MSWLLIGVLAWVALALPMALLIGRSIRVADRKQAARARAAAEANFIATDEPPVQIVEQPWTGPSTLPFAPSRLPWGGDRTALQHPRLSVVRHPVTPVERLPGARDTGPV